MRLLLVVIAVGACLWAIRAAGGFGLSRLLVKYALATRSLAAAQKAMEQAPLDAQAHRASGAVFSSMNQPAEAARELERAAALRPADYSLWLGLGLLRDQIGDRTGALAAFDEAVRRAPFYAQPRWQRGNLLLRAGQYEAGFNDLNQAARSNPELIPSLIDLAWGLSKGDPNLTEELAQIKTEKRRIAFARYLARQGKAKDAIAQLKAAGTLSDDIRREVIQGFLSKGAFQEAFEIWRAGQASATGSEPTGASIHDGSFEAPLSLSEMGFGWKVAHGLNGATFSLDSNQPHSGSNSLRIDFDGESNPGLALASQLILVEPSKRYKVNFAFRTENVITGGVPLAVASDASGDGKRLGQSAPLSKSNDGWQVLSFEFTTTNTTKAVSLNVQRENCTSSPCPIFGSISLDSFSMEQVK